jgi:RNA polymerase sigma-70 factor (ECF subfamily)
LYIIRNANSNNYEGVPELHKSVPKTSLQSKDKAKIKQIYEKYYGLMVYVAKEILKDHALAEDAAMEGLEKLAGIIEQVDDDILCNKTKWLVVIIVKRISLNMLKKSNRLEYGADGEFEFLVSNSPEVADEIISVEGYKDIVAIIDELSPALKDVAVLSLIHDSSDKQIAEILEINHGTVRTRLNRAKEFLRNKLSRGDSHAGR